MQRSGSFIYTTLYPLWLYSSEYASTSSGQKERHSPQPLHRSRLITTVPFDICVLVWEYIECISFLHCSAERVISMRLHVKLAFVLC
jgi:hypothetical protein